MNCAPQLTADEFKDVHNAKCELHGVLQAMDGVVSEKLYARLEKAIALMNKGLKSAYEQDEAAYDRRDKHTAAISEEIGATTVWSVDGVEDLNTNHPYTDATCVTYKDHWGPKPVSVEIKGPTWKDLYRAADKAIRMSGDQHHVFIEAFSQVMNEPGLLLLSTGS